MSRFVLLLIVSLLASAGAVGCRSCAGQLDYCGPMPDEPCDFMHRRNSILGGDKRPEAMAALAERKAQEAAEEAGEAGAEGGGEFEEGENVPTPAPIPAPELEEGELGEPGVMPTSPETGVFRQGDPYAEDGAPLSPEAGMDSQYDPYAGEAVPYGRYAGEGIPYGRYAGEGVPYAPQAGAAQQTDPYAIERMPPRGANYGSPSRTSHRPLLRRIFR